MEKLTLKMLKDMPPGEVFLIGKTVNSPDGIYLTDSRRGDNIVWAAKRGGIHDWAIYAAWEESGISFALTNGQKITTEDYIRKLVPCDDEAFAMYRG